MPTTPVERESLSDGSLGAGIRSVRLRRHMSVSELAKRVGVNKGYISRIERGEKSPSIATVFNVARALEVSVDHLFGHATSREAVVVTRAADASVDRSRTLQMVLPPASDRRLSAFLLQPEPQGHRRGAVHPGDELLFVLSGEVEVLFDDRAVRLGERDSISFPGHLKHRVRSIGTNPAEILVVIGQDLPTGSP